MELLNILNFGFVLFFGITLTLEFAEVSFSLYPKRYLAIYAVFGLAQYLAFKLLSEEILYKAYPLLIHLPLFLLLVFYFHKNIYLSGICVLSAYLFCTPRKWIGTFVSFLYGYNKTVQGMTEILITLPLLFLIVKYVSPSVIRLKNESDKVLKLFLIFPVFYYIMEYAFTVYTDWLYRGGAVMVEFMDAFIAILYFLLTVAYLKIFYEKKELEIHQLLSETITTQSLREIETLKKSEQQNTIYRHDVRHHINFLTACIRENRLQDALDYIAQISERIDSIKVDRYSSNEPINLILSSYAAKAKLKSISMTFRVSATDFSRFQIVDLCTLFSNALENALIACEQSKDPDAYVNFHLYEKNNKLCISVRNTYTSSPSFEDGIPVSFRENHSIGTKSMVYVVEKYQGIYKFRAENGVFLFQASM